MPSGNLCLVTMIKEEILANGPIPFAQFMELALYHPVHGYYMDRASAGNRIGWTGDFYTSSDLHPFLARVLARQASQVDELLNHPDPFIFLEMGPGNGTFASHFLSACRNRGGSFWNRLRYILVEQSQALHAKQQAELADFVSADRKVEWYQSLSDLESNLLVGLVFSNELVDAFPVHRIAMETNRLREIYVDVEADQFVERLGPPSTEKLQQYLNRLDIHLPDGYRTEINLKALRWMQEVGQALHRGIVITCDYGHTARDLFCPDRNRGTLLCYREHTLKINPFSNVGQQDMTTHVDFSSLASVGEAAGLSLTGFTNYMSFLTSVGMDMSLEDMDPTQPETLALIQLFRPEGMGKTFKILVQHKGIPCPELDGLRFKPFFASALDGHMDAFSRIGTGIA